MIVFDRLSKLFVRYVLIEQSPGKPATFCVFAILLKFMRLIVVDKEHIPGIPEFRVKSVEYDASVEATFVDILEIPYEGLYDISMASYTIKDDVIIVDIVETPAVVKPPNAATVLFEYPARVDKF